MICLGFCGGAWSQEEPAGEGRPITPAGTLVIDATTHLPAVGAMPMAMLRSPILSDTAARADISWWSTAGSACSSAKTRIEPSNRLR